jgi:thiol-disulfide isomerase/thioredoxin
MRRHLLPAVIVLVVLSSAGGLCGQERKAPDLPENPALWLSSGPLSNEALAGKGVFLWFFEETCPRCAGKWPEMMALSKKHQGEPVVFIAVNSGTPRQTIAAYVRQHRITWPVLLDPGRGLEPAFNVNEINLNNVYQARLILADGTWQTASINNLEAGVERAAAGAEWNIDPEQIPRELLAAWQSIEFGNYQAAALAVQKGLKTTKPEVKQGAELLQQYIDEKLDEQLKSATEALEADRKWEAYKTYKLVSTKFKGYPLPSEVASSLRTLERDPAVNREVKALRILESAQKALDGTPGGQRRANGLFAAIQRDYPMTEAAALAEKQSLDP